MTMLLRVKKILSKYRGFFCLIFSADEDGASRSMITKKRKKQDSVGSTDPDRGSNLLQVRDKNSQNAVNGAAKELRRNYSKKVADRLAVLTKTSLKMLSKHFSSASTDVKAEDVDGEDVSAIVFVLTASLSIPDIDVRPSIDEVQLVLINAGKIILSVSKGVATWRQSIKKSKKEKLKNGSGKKGDKDFVPSSESGREMKLYNPKKEEKPVITEKNSNFFKSVYENKEVSKMYSMLSGCMQGIKLEFNVFSKIWDTYKHIWEIDREDTINTFLKDKPKLKDFEDELFKYKIAKSQLTTEKSEYR